MKSSEFKKRMIFNLVLIVSLAVTITSMSFAWFFDGGEAGNKISDINIQTLSGKSIDISTDQENWKKAITDTEIDDVEFSPVVGNGKVFFKPVYEYQVLDSQSREKLYGNVLTKYMAIIESDMLNYMFSSVYYVKTDYNGVLYLSSDSYILPLSPNERKVDGIGASADYIVGAMRVSFLIGNDDGSYSTKLIWIPKPDYELTESSFKKNGTKETSYAFVYGSALTSYNNIYLDGFDSNNTKTLNGITYLLGDFVSDFELAEVTANTSVKMKVNVWLDGLDRECMESLSGGKFKINLSLRAV